MNHLRLAIAMLCAFGVSSAHADPIRTYYVTEANIVMGPNIGGLAGRDPLSRFST